MVVPSLMILLYLGVFIIILNCLNIPTDLLNVGFDSGLNLMNTFIKWITTWDNFILNNITFDGIMLIISYVFLLMLFRFFKAKTYHNLSIVLVGIIMLQGYYVWRFKYQTKTEFIVFHNVKSSVLGFREGLFVNVYQTDSLQHRFVENYAIGEGLTNIEIETLKPFYRISNSNLLLVDSLGIYDFKSTKIDWVLLRESPKIHLADLIERLQPSCIIADGSNYKSDIMRWKKTCSNYGVLFHNTSENGAFIYPIK